MEAPELGLMHFWQAADAVTRGVALILLAMSVASWGVILWKTLMSWRIRGTCARGLARFWQASSLEEGVATLRREDPEGLFFPMAARLQSLRSANALPVSVSASAGADEETTRVLREEMQRSNLRVEAGLTLLASVGSTSPFIGLFGTVWGIYHALIAIAATGQVAIERIAGPVGEALIMTAAGLAVAIPAVLAYNAFTRINRATLASLDGFAHDLAALGR